MQHCTPTECHCQCANPAALLAMEKAPLSVAGPALRLNVNGMTCSCALLLLLLVFLFLFLLLLSLLHHPLCPPPLPLFSSPVLSALILLSGCVSSVTAALQSVQGVSGPVQVDLASKLALVPGSPSLKDCIEALDSIGYEAQAAPAEADDGSLPLLSLSLHSLPTSHSPSILPSLSPPPHR